MKYISFSQISRYLTCPRSYKYYYVDRLREKTQTAFLAFGSAMDNALNAILLDHKANKSVTVDYKQKFDDEWQNITINKQTYPLRDCHLIGYAKADFVPELLTPEDITAITEYGGTTDDIKVLHNELEELRSNRATIPFSVEQHKLLNVINWHSMRRKAHLMLDAYVRDIVPEIEEVLDVQKKVELQSPCGTKMLGYVDAIVRFKGYTDPTVVDNKTAFSAYDTAKLDFSPQLANYCYQLGINQAAYAVMIKAIRLNKVKTCTSCGYVAEGSRAKTCDAKVEGKRCGGAWTEQTSPEAKTQLIKGAIPKLVQEMVVDNAAEVLDSIKSGHFPRNLNTCQNIYGNPCPYINLCWKNKTDGLEHVSDEK